MLFGEWKKTLAICQHELFSLQPKAPRRNLSTIPNRKIKHRRSPTGVVHIKLIQRNNRSSRINNNSTNNSIHPANDFIILMSHERWNHFPPAKSLHNESIWNVKFVSLATLKILSIHSPSLQTYNELTSACLAYNFPIKFFHLLNYTAKAYTGLAACAS